MKVFNGLFVQESKATFVTQLRALREKGFEGNQESRGTITLHSRGYGPHNVGYYRELRAGHAIVQILYGFHVVV